MSRITINDYAPRFKMFIPCQSGRCPERMQLINWRSGDGVAYKCPRPDCIFHASPIPALNIRPSLAWVRDGEKDYHKSHDNKPPTAKEMETMI